MKIKDNGEARIPHIALLISHTIHANGVYNFGLMCELKKAGAPIMGVFDLYPDTSFLWEMEIESNGTHDVCIYRWNREAPE